MTRGVAIDPSQPDQVGPALLQYLAGCLGASDLRFAEPPEPVGVGWETYIYTFRLAGDNLDPMWARPLVLRIYPGADQGPKAEHEASVQRFAVERGYPAARPLLVETDVVALGGPFMVMERAPGVPMLDRMTANPLAGFRLAGLMADLHVALHHLPIDGFPLPSEGPLVERWLAGFREKSERFGLEGLGEAFVGLGEAFAWLEEHKGMVIPEEPSILHNDFHPLNIMVSDDGQMTVIDWPDAMVGDRHHDIANTLLLIRTAPVEARSLAERLLTRFGRSLFVSLYLRRYRQQLPIDRERLRYWEALRAFGRWAMTAAFQASGSESLGMKADTAGRVPASQLDLLRRYFWQRARP